MFRNRVSYSNKSFESDMAVVIAIIFFVPLTLCALTVISTCTHCHTPHTKNIKIILHHHGGHICRPAASTSSSQTPRSLRLTLQTCHHPTTSSRDRHTTPSPPPTPFFYCRWPASSAEQVGGCPCNVFQARAHLPTCPAALRLYEESNAAWVR